MDVGDNPCTMYILALLINIVFLRIVFNPLTAKCRIYPAQQEYCVRQQPDISSDICLDYFGTWRRNILSLAYIIKKV